MNIRICVVIILFIAFGQFFGCAQAGRLKLEDKTYTFNRSDIVKEKGGRYRIWVWSYEPSLNYPFGSSPAGVQMLLPAGASVGMICALDKDCKLWFREFWYLVGALSGGIWENAESGIIILSVWDPEGEVVAGSFEAHTKKGPISGTFRVSPRTHDKNLMR